jgi:hypothetical protein
MARFLAPALLFLAFAAAGCAGVDEPEPPRWTERQAASITTVRTMPVRVVRCRGLGKVEEGSFTRIECLAGTRAPWETYDTIAVTYVVRPLGEYESLRSRHGLLQVRFIGGPGIP